MRRFLPAVWRALLLTLRGETLTPPHYRPLEAWTAAGLEQLSQVRAAAERENIDLESLELKLDGRPTSLERSLLMLRHNLVNEYPRLIRLDDPYSMMVVQSSNLNDQYRLSQFIESNLLSPPTLHQALTDLNSHLLNLPQVDRPDS